MNKNIEFNKNKALFNLSVLEKFVVTALDEEDSKYLKEDLDYIRSYIMQDNDDVKSDDVPTADMSIEDMFMKIREHMGSSTFENGFGIAIADRTPFECGCGICQNEIPGFDTEMDFGDCFGVFQNLMNQDEDDATTDEKLESFTAADEIKDARVDFTYPQFFEPYKEAFSELGINTKDLSIDNYKTLNCVPVIRPNKLYYNMPLYLLFLLDDRQEVIDVDASGDVDKVVILTAKEAKQTIITRHKKADLYMDTKSLTPYSLIEIKLS